MSIQFDSVKLDRVSATQRRKQVRPMELVFHFERDFPLANIDFHLASRPLPTGETAICVERRNHLLIASDRIPYP
jgi:hypothetical protein